MAHPVHTKSQYPPAGTLYTQPYTMKTGAIVTGSNLGSPPIDLTIHSDDLHSDILFVLMDSLAGNSRDMIGQQNNVE